MMKVKSMGRHGAFRRVLLGMLVMMAAGGCAFIWEKEDAKKLDWGVAERPVGEVSAAMADTIGAMSYYDNMAPLRVAGFGVVMGLGNNGSRDCPKDVFQTLVEEMYKQHDFSTLNVNGRSVTPERLIQDVDTAVVLVEGWIPAAAVPGKRFDVSVRALPGTQTRSLRGGRLLPTELKLHSTSATGRVITGRTMARAAGPLFLNPFSGEEAALQTSSLEATILGGGMAVEQREVRLVLSAPSYVMARRIQDRLNSHFPGEYRVANAISPSFIKLRLPREYKDDEGHFLALTRGLYLSTDPQFTAMRSRMLGQELLEPTAPHAQIALAFEALGQPALPVLQDLYSHQEDHVSFHAGVAGMRLGDHLAVDALSGHATDKDSPHRFQAIRALGEARGMASAVITLRRLLHDSDPRVQIAAFEELDARRDSTLQREELGAGNFVLARVPEVANRFLYVRRTAEQKIVLFGDGIQCTPPILYRATDGAVTISARPGDEQLTLMRTVVATGSSSPPVSAPLDVYGLVKLMGSSAEEDFKGNVLGLGLDYGDVARALYQLCSRKAINAEFVLEQPNAAELFGPPELPGRPESSGGRPESEL